MEYSVLLISLPVLGTCQLANPLTHLDLQLHFSFTDQLYLHQLHPTNNNLTTTLNNPEQP